MIPIAQPLADENTTKRIQKVMKERRGTGKVHRGIKHCQKMVLKNTNGILVLAADTTPMDLITHLPALCEERNIPYIFVHTRHSLKVVNPKSVLVTCCFIEVDDYMADERVQRVVARCLYNANG